MTLYYVVTAPFTSLLGFRFLWLYLAVPRHGYQNRKKLLPYFVLSCLRDFLCLFVFLCAVCVIMCAAVPSMLWLRDGRLSAMDCTGVLHFVQKIAPFCQCQGSHHQGQILIVWYWMNPCGQIHVLTALCSDAEALLEAFVRMGAGDDFRAGAPYVHIPLTLDDVTGITLQPISYNTHTEIKISTTDSIISIYITISI